MSHSVAGNPVRFDYQADREDDEWESAMLLWIGCCDRADSAALI